MHPYPVKYLALSLDTGHRASGQEVPSGLTAVAGSSSRRFLRWQSIRKCPRSMEVVMLCGTLGLLPHSCACSSLSFTKLSTSRHFKIRSRRRTLERLQGRRTIPRLAVTPGNCTAREVFHHSCVPHFTFLEGNAI